ncbi:hypothetical protein [Muricoccus aerilatus]|uniref:hypothetical protein n=1 Tax=Muricoccus aerilatus TaxID=452982 RepID=UPI0005C1337A|nr:hypothetical protein [Roseomonas aerilata]
MAQREKDHDPGDSVPPGVAPKYPPPLTEEDLRVKRKLEQLGGGKRSEPGQPQGQAETDGPEKLGA